MNDVFVSGTTAEFEKPKEGVVKAVCSAVWDIGLQKGQWQGETLMQYKVVLRFELDEVMKQGKFAGKRFCLNPFYTKSLGKKANLRHILESWRGKPFTAEELAKFNLSKLIGANCLVNIGYKESTGKPYIMSIMPLAAGMQKIEPELDTNEIPEWIQKFIVEGKANEEACSVVSEGSVPEDDTEIPF